MTFKTTKGADEDLIAIFLQGLAQFGLAQADAYHDELQETFHLLARFPLIGQLAVRPAVRIHPHRSHIIVYEPTDWGVLILRVRHGREAWSNDPIGLAD